MYTSFFDYTTVGRLSAVSICGYGMFDSNQCEELKASLPDFSLDYSCASMAPMPFSMQLYLEFYGFFDTIKGIEVEYFFGFRRLIGVTSKRKETQRIATHFWQLPEAKACIFIAHGLFDHVGLFQKLVRFLLLQGYSVVAIDLPGHGLSDGKPTAVNNFADYSSALMQTFEYFQPFVGEQPSYGIGQSTGAAVLMSAVFTAKRAGKSLMFQRLAFLGPLVRPRGAKLGRFAYIVLRHFISQIKRDFSSPNSNDSEFHHFLHYYDPLQSKVLSLTWIGAMFNWMDEFEDQPKIETPLLILQGTNDRVVDWKFNVPAIQEHFSQSQVGYVKGAMHHLANESDPWRKVIFSVTGRFLKGPRKAR